MIKKCPHLLLLLFVLTFQQLQAQRFSMGLGIGATLAQMDGDNFEGYDKLGLRVGIRGEAYLSPRWDVILEMNIEEKGSRLGDDPTMQSGDKNRVISLTYAEMPLLLRYFLFRRPGLYLESGVAVSYLLKSKFTVHRSAPSLQNFEEISPDFNRNEWNAVLGGGLTLNPRLGFYFRTTIGFSHLYRNLEVKEAYVKAGGKLGVGEHQPIFQLRNYLVSLGAYINI